MNRQISHEIIIDIEGLDLMEITYGSAVTHAYRQALLEIIAATQAMNELIVPAGRDRVTLLAIAGDDDERLERAQLLSWNLNRVRPQVSGTQLAALISVEVKKHDDFILGVNQLCERNIAKNPKAIHKQKVN